MGNPLGQVIEVCPFCNSEYIRFAYPDNLGMGTICKVCRKRSDRESHNKFRRWKAPSFVECANPGCANGFYKGGHQLYCGECMDYFRLKKMREYSREWRRKNKGELKP